MNKNLTPIQTELLNRADSIFKTNAETASKVSDFAAEQLPDIAYHYIAMERVYLSSIVGLAILFIIASSIFVWKFTVKNCMNFTGYDDDLRYYVLFPYTFIVIVLFIVFFTNLKSLIMVWFAPKIYIITNIVTLIKG